MTRHVITYDGRVGRWDPDARGRLERAALDLFAERGFAATTVPQITERAGLTTRTFFRHFADKREVLFASADGLRAELVELVRSAPAGASPLELVEFGLRNGAATLFGPRFDDVRHWRAVVATDESLRERALRKQQLSIAAASEALRERGLDEPTADLVAGMSLLLMEQTVGRWVAQPTEVRPLTDYVEETVAGLRALGGVGA
jgi:AcrR family transcriptional regulator